MAGKAERILTRWALVIAGGHGPYLAGQEASGLMRTSTPLVTFDPAALTGTTASGRPYRLVGDPDESYARHVIDELWGQIYDLEGADIRMVQPEEAVAFIAEKGNAPFAFPAPEMQADEVRKLMLIGRGIRRQLTLASLSVDEAARLVRLPVEPFRRLVGSDVAGIGITVDQAEHALAEVAAYADGRHPTQTLSIGGSAFDDLVIPDPTEEELAAEAYGGGNVFRDLGVSNPDVALVKADLASGIAVLIEENAIPTEEVVALTGLSAQQVAGILARGDIEGLSIARLDKVYEALEARASAPGRQP